MTVTIGDVLTFRDVKPVGDHVRYCPDCGARVMDA